MIIRFFALLVLAFAFSGCATTQMKNQNDQLSTRVTELEKNLQAKDAEIVDLQYQVKDLSSKIEASKPAETDQAAAGSSSNTAEAAVSTPADASENSRIIRVHASPEKIQRALKAAGVYTGPIDGRIGQGTKEAIVEFQKSHGLKADGVLGRHTWEELKTYLK